MMEPDTILLSSKPRRRMLLWAAVIGCPFVLVFAWLGYKWYLDREYRAAIEEADRLDPGWRLAELEAGCSLSQACDAQGDRRWKK